MHLEKWMKAMWEHCVPRLLIVMIFELSADNGIYISSVQTLFIEIFKYTRMFVF
jgi:hypothetical protein